MTSESNTQVKVPKGTRDLDPFQMAVRKDVISKLSNCFERHGAETIDTPVFELKEILLGKYGEDSKLIYDLADQGGELLSLRYDLTVPFARYMAMNGLKRMKRYHIGKVYRRDNPAVTRGRFREFTQCDYDVAGPSEGMLADAEVLRVLHDCLESLGLGVPYTIKLSHRGILDAILELSGVKPEQVRSISSSVDKLDKLPWESVREEMIQKGLTEEVANKVGAYVVKRGAAREVLSVLEADETFNANARGKTSVAEMRQLVDTLEILNVLPLVVFDLGLARGLDYYTGIIFEVVMNLPSEDSGETRVGSIAAGGRYDNLINMFGGDPVPAVGMSIGIERIFSLVEEEYRKRSTLRSISTKVLVAVAGNEPRVLKERLLVCSTLWDARIACEFLPLLQPKLKYQLDYANTHNIPFVIIVGMAELEHDSVIVRNMQTKEQVTFSLKTLTADFKQFSFPAI
jgi:histidyl-tRNA synthetase